MQVYRHRHTETRKNEQKTRGDHYYIISELNYTHAVSLLLIMYRNIQEVIKIHLILAVYDHR